MNGPTLALAPTTPVGPVVTPSGPSAAVGPSALASVVRTSDLPRVVHVPDGHGYVEHVSTSVLDPDAVARPRTAVRFSWTDDDPGWVRRHAGSFDVLHVHFGFEQWSLERLRTLLDELDAAGRALVWTAHDLTNPHLVDQSAHEAQLALLAERAAVVLTLTEGAAEQIAHRWGREAVVVAHPHLAPPEVLARARRPRTGPAVVGLPLGMLRPSTDRRTVLALLDLAPDLPATLRVHLREEVLAAGFPRPDRDLVRRLHVAAQAGHVDLRVGGRLDEAALWDELAGLSALVLPYAWGTHSGWVESCFDVGTPVVAPDHGCWGEQQDVHRFASARDGGPDPASLDRAVRAALATGPRQEDVLVERLVQREVGLLAHERVHRLAAAGGRL